MTALPVFAWLLHLLVLLWLVKRWGSLSGKSTFQRLAALVVLELVYFGAAFALGQTERERLKQTIAWEGPELEFTFDGKVRKVDTP